MTPDQRLLAYLDNELPPEERARFEADMVTDEWLSTEVAKHRGLAARLQAAQARADNADRLGRRDREPAAEGDDVQARRLGLMGVAAMAASLAFGVALGALLWPVPGPVASGGGALLANAHLEKALDHQLSGQFGRVRIDSSFRTRAGHICRTFESPSDRLAGVACHDQARWLARALIAWNPPGPIPPAVRLTVDAIIDGEPLDPAAERAARDRDWAS